MKRGMRLRPGRPVAVAVLAAFVSIASAAPAAAVVLYAVVVTPPTANQYSATDFSVTISNLNLLDDLGCLQLDLPASFSIVSLSQPDASNGEDWLISRSGQSVVVQSDGGGGRLELGDSVSFTVRAKPQQAGIFAWEHHAHRDQDCDGGDLLGAPVTVTVLPAVLPTPTLAPLPTILPTPTPLPTILPTPTLAPLPSILPTAKPTPRPTRAPSPTPGGAASQPPGPTSGDASPSDPPTSGGAAPRAPGGSGSGAAPGAAPDLDREPEPAAGPTAAGGESDGGLDLRQPRDMRLSAPTESDGGLGLSPFSLLVEMGAWYVPAAVIGGPGLLVIGFVALQLAGAAAWMPAVRRLRGEKPAAR